MQVGKSLGVVLGTEQDVINSSHCHCYCHCHCHGYATATATAMAMPLLLPLLLLLLRPSPLLLDRWAVSQMDTQTAQASETEGTSVQLHTPAPKGLLGGSGWGEEQLARQTSLEHWCPGSFCG